MRSPWSILRCRLLQRHRWEPVERNGDKGWECRDCPEQVFEREYLERVYDNPDFDEANRVATTYGGAAGVHGPPGF